MYNYDIEKQQALMKLKKLQEVFDKAYLEEMFDALVESGIESRNQNMVYEYKGYIYILRREPKSVLGGLPNVPT